VRAAELWECAASRCLFEDGEVVQVATGERLSTQELLTPASLETEHEFHHRPTRALDADGQGDAHVSFMFAAHRAVVDVDPELGLLRVVQVATGQDVGKAINPIQVTGQIEGGIAQGVGLAVMEEIVVTEGRVRNPSFTDYLLPTVLDMPEVLATVIEEPEPDAPYGAKGVGEPPTISSGPAVLAAIRDATGLPVTRAPVRPEDIALAHFPRGGAQTAGPHPGPAPGG
jgi:CO/xanthine dehydrogenase Mo-binding subunit